MNLSKITKKILKKIFNMMLNLLFELLTLMVIITVIISSYYMSERSNMLIKNYKEPILFNHTVYYKFDTNVLSLNMQKRIKNVLYNIEEKTCLRFIFNNNSKDGLIFLPNDDEYSLQIGYLKTETKIYLIDRLFKIYYNIPIFKHLNAFYDNNSGYKLIREILHALGLNYQHQMIDRNNYIKINWYVIDKYYYHNFLLINDTRLNTFQYDGDSIMQYSSESDLKLIKLNSIFVYLFSNKK
jgi:hypothetical protein